MLKKLNKLQTKRVDELTYIAGMQRRYFVKKIKYLYAIIVMLSMTTAAFFFLWMSK